jgi:DDE family transposase
MTHWTRLSCHRFRANEVRLLLSVIAYNLGNLLRRLCCRSRFRTGRSRACNSGSSRPAGG